MSFLSSPKYKVDLLLINTGELFQMEDLKREILLKRNQMFHIYHNKLMTVDEFENKIVNARNYLEVIDIASFEDYKD